MPESPSDQSTWHGQHRYQAAGDREQQRDEDKPAGEKAPECLATFGKVRAKLLHLLNLRRDDGGGTSEVVGRDRRMARGNLRRLSSHLDKRSHLRRLAVPELVARELRAKMGSDILLRRGPLLLRLERGIGA